MHIPQDELEDLLTEGDIAVSTLVTVLTYLGYVISVERPSDGERCERINEGSSRVRHGVPDENTECRTRNMPRSSMGRTMGPMPSCMVGEDIADDGVLRDRIWSDISRVISHQTRPISEEIINRLHYAVFNSPIDDVIKIARQYGIGVVAEGETRNRTINSGCARPRPRAVNDREILDKVNGDVQTPSFNKDSLLRMLEDDNFVNDLKSFIQSRL